jgi:hypothetical protein
MSNNPRSLGFFCPTGLTPVGQIQPQQFAQGQVALRSGQGSQVILDPGMLARLPGRLEAEVERVDPPFHRQGERARGGRGVPHAISCSQVLRITRSRRSTVGTAQPRRSAISTLV